MYELREFAQDGPLRQVLNRPWFQPWNGIEGIALAYDDRAVAEAEHIADLVWPRERTGTIESSRIIARILAELGRRSEDKPGDELFDFPHHYFSREYRYPSRRSPLVVEVTVGPEYGREAGPIDIDTLESGDLRRYNYRIRRTRGSRLQGAAAGGRIARSTKNQVFGTIGGFLTALSSSETYAVTAAHVCDGNHGIATPTVLPHASTLVRNGIRQILKYLPFLPPEYQQEVCPFHSGSNPDFVLAPKCNARDSAITAGIDAALHCADTTKLDRRFPVQVAHISDISQILDLNFVGAKSGFQRAAVASYSIWHNYLLEDDKPVCIHDCVQVKLAERPYVRTDLSQGGDSGAWLLARGRRETYWVGMLTGGDGERAGIVPAPRIIEHFEKILNAPLSAEI